MTTDSHLQVDRRGAVWCVTLNRPEIGNALSNALVAELFQIVNEATRDSDVATLVLRGAGRHFCTGFDLSALDQETDESLIGRFVRVELLLQTIWNAPFRTVALVHGRVMGAGADLCVACDERMIEGDASFAFPGAQFGVVLGTARLAQRVGSATAIDWVQRGAVIDAASALSAGLATGRRPAAEPRSGENIEPWLAETRLASETSRAIRQAAHRAEDRCEEHDGRDLLQLAHSLARPGLADRIKTYRARSQGKKG